MPKEKTKRAKDLLNPPEKTASEVEEMWGEIIRSRQPLDQERENWEMWKTPHRIKINLEEYLDDNLELWQHHDEKDD